MKTRTVMLFALLALPLVLGQLTPALADEGGLSATGDLEFTAEEFGIDQGLMHFNIRQVSAEAHAAEGTLNWEEHSEDEGWRKRMSHAICMVPGDDPKKAVVVVQIDGSEGWGEGDPGQYLTFWIYDGGTPATAGDDVQTVNWPPSDEQPPCEYAEPTFFAGVWTKGDLVIETAPAALPVTGLAGPSDHALEFTLAGLAVLVALGVGLLRHRTS
jgi:hypothetical protein